MSVYYEFALTFNFKRSISQEVVNTLKYMTRTQEYFFDAPFENSLFNDAPNWKKAKEISGRKVWVLSAWRTIIANFPREGEQYLPGEFGSKFEDYSLNVRRLSLDDTFCNVWWYLTPWFASLSETTGCVGYYHTVFEYDNDLTLVFFKDGKVFEYEVIPITTLQLNESELEGEVEPLLNLQIHYLPNLVREGLIRKAEENNLSLSEYISSVVAKKQPEIPIEILQDIDLA